MQVTDAPQLVEKLQEKLEKLFRFKNDLSGPPTRGDENYATAERDLQLLSQCSLIESSQSCPLNSRAPGISKIPIENPSESVQTLNNDVKEVKNDGTAAIPEIDPPEILGADSADENVEILRRSRSPSPSLLISCSLEAISQSVELQELLFSSENGEEEIPRVNATDLDSRCNSMSLVESNRFKRRCSRSSPIVSVSCEKNYLVSQNFTQPTSECGRCFSTPTSEDELNRDSGSWSQIFNSAEEAEMTQVPRLSNNEYRETSEDFSSQSSSCASSQSLPSSLESSSSVYSDESAESLHECLPPELSSSQMDISGVELDGSDEAGFFLSEPGVGLDPEIFRAILDSLN